MSILLKDVEEIWLEVYFPTSPPVEVINKLKLKYTKSNDGFYIPEKNYGDFKIDALPHQAQIMQQFVHKDISLEERKRLFIDMVKELKAAGVGGMDTWLTKYAELPNPRIESELK